VIASWLNAPKEFRSGWDIDSEWYYAPNKNQGRPEEFFGFDSWKIAAEMFLRLSSLYPEQFFLLRYDLLNDSPEPVTEALFNFCGLDMNQQVKDFLCASKTRHESNPYSVFRANATDRNWRNVLPSNISNRIVSELVNTPLAQFISDVDNA
jgi:hypothetical protein